MFWTATVELVRSLILVIAQLCNGSLGAAVVLVSLGLRLSLLPLTIYLARRSREQQAILQSIAPELEQLRRRHGHDPVTHYQKTSALHRRVGYRPLDPASLLAAAVQWPLMMALFAAVRRGLGTRVSFLWIADLARPNVGLVAIVTALSGIGALATPAPAAAPSWMRAMAMVAPLATLLMLLPLSSTVALSYGTGSLVSIAQGWLLERDRRSPRNGRRQSLAGK